MIMDDYFKDTVVSLEDANLRATDEAVVITDILDCNPISVGYDEIPDLIHYLLSAYTNRP